MLASLKEFVKTWGSGNAGSFQLVCKDGQAKLSMEFSLESPGSSHFTAPEDNQDTWKRDKRRKNPSTLRRDKKRAEQRRAQVAVPVPDAGHALRGVEEHERADQHGDASPDPSDHAAGTKTAKSKKKLKKIRENGGEDSEPNNLYELEVYRTEPMTWKTARVIPKALSRNVTEAFSKFYDSGTEMVEGAPLLPFDPPVLWDVDTSLWDYVEKQGLSGRVPLQKLVALKNEILTKTGPHSPIMKEFWAALSFGMTAFSCQDRIHLGWRRRPGLDGGLGGSSWTLEQVMELRARLWATETDFRVRLGREVTSLKAETASVQDICMATGLMVRYETLGPDSWDLILA